ncbi:unnamed protein product [Caenorhabditis bovis]|uniref:BHLH domain-containing protein n=1 Tax=Caenorhabditis bovis TaxID=2654633 RepID=A0A8S1EFR5_9PELO|nr:unnamed protein product [Caenorhabditis bovis]
MSAEARKLEIEVAELERRLKANSRERRRVNQLNDMFETLLLLLPPSNFQVKLSRVQILREAADYIACLQEYLKQPCIIGAEVLFPHIFETSRCGLNKKSTYRKFQLNRRPEPSASRIITIRRPNFIYTSTSLDAFPMQSDHRMLPSPQNENDDTPSYMQL